MANKPKQNPDDRYAVPTGTQNSWELDLDCKPPQLKRKYPYKFLFVSLCIFAFDQLSKYIIRTYFYRCEIPVFGDTFKLTHVQNPAAAFSISLGSDDLNQVFFTSISIILIVIILWLLRKANIFWEKLAFAMVIGGALGNTLDRILLGSVTDFLDFDFPDVIMERWPIFNLADSSIVIAMFMLLYTTLFVMPKYERFRDNRQPEYTEIKD